MKLSHVEHIGIVVKNLNDAIEFYENILGLKCYGIEEVKDQKVRTAFFKIGETKIELLESTETDSPVGKFINKHGEGIHHIAFATDDLNSSIDELKRKNIRLIDENPRSGAEKLNIVFLHPKDTFSVLTELCEKKK